MSIEAVRAFTKHPRPGHPLPRGRPTIGDLDVLLSFYDFPEPHRKHPRTTNPIESTFSTVRLRTRVTKGAGNRQAAVAMAYKLLDAAQDRWRRINGHELVALVRAGATFIDGQQREQNDEHQHDERANAEHAA